MFQLNYQSNTLNGFKLYVYSTSPKNKIGGGTGLTQSVVQGFLKPIPISKLHDVMPDLFEGDGMATVYVMSIPLNEILFDEKSRSKLLDVFTDKDYRSTVSIPWTVIDFHEIIMETEAIYGCTVLSRDLSSGRVKDFTYRTKYQSDHIGKFDHEKTPNKQIPMTR